MENQRNPREKKERNYVTFKEAKAAGYVTFAQLKKNQQKPSGPPAAYVRTPKGLVCLFDPNKIKDNKPARNHQRAACRSCGALTSNLSGLCRKCTQLERLRQEKGAFASEKTVAEKRDLSRMVFLDLEMTGDAKADEILSVSITDGNGKVLMDSLVHPKVAKKWPFTVHIHHITPQMVRNAPTIDELEPQILEILSSAEEILGYSISNDWLHLKRLPSIAAVAEDLESKISCCQRFYDRFVKEDRPDLDNGKRSLETAMTMLDLPWEGRQHTSLADTLACVRVWKRMFLEPSLIPFRPAEEIIQESLSQEDEPHEN